MSFAGHSPLWLLGSRMPRLPIMTEPLNPMSWLEISRLTWRARDQAHALSSIAGIVLQTMKISKEVSFPGIVMLILSPGARCPSSLLKAVDPVSNTSLYQGGSSRYYSKGHMFPLPRRDSLHSVLSKTQQGCQRGSSCDVKSKGAEASLAVERRGPGC